MTDTLVELWTRLLNNDRVQITEHDWPTHYGSRSYPTRPAHVDVAAEVKASPEPAPGAEWYEITLADYSDYGGSDLDAANVRTLTDTYDCENESIAYSGERAYVILGDAKFDVETLTALVEAIESLDDYPILDEEHHSEYILELSDEAWDQWLRDDFADDAKHLFDEDPDDASAQYEASDDFFAEHEEELREAYYSFEDNWWTAESATSVKNDNHAAAVEYAVKKVRGF